MTPAFRSVLFGPTCWSCGTHLNNKQISAHAHIKLVIIKWDNGHFALIPGHSFVLRVCGAALEPVIVRLFLGISQSFVPQIVFTKPEIYILFRIFWTVSKSQLSQTSDVDNCSRRAQSLDYLRMRNCISHAGFCRFLT